MTNAPAVRFGRRQILRLTAGALCGAAAGTRPAFAGPQHGPAAHGAPAAGSPTAATALAELIAGNARFEHSAMKHGHQSASWWRRLAAGQRPFAAVFTCSDSRVCPEVVFDQGLGDLFVIRNAGHVADEAAVASIEYAAAHLGVPLVLVLGHEGCGAVQATIDAVTSGAPPEGHLSRLVEAIRPAVQTVPATAGAAVDLAVRAHVERTVVALEASRPVLADLAAAGRLTVVGARYDLDTGHVELLRAPRGVRESAR